MRKKVESRLGLLAEACSAVLESAALEVRERVLGQLFVELGVPGREGTEEGK
jgi:hypothetical protein